MAPIVRVMESLRILAWLRFMFASPYLSSFSRGRRRMAPPHKTLRSFPVLMAAGLGGLDLAAGQRRGFKDPLKTDGGFVIWLFGAGGAGPFEAGVAFFSWTHE